VRAAVLDPGPFERWYAGAATVIALGIGRHGSVRP
jgi:hypothetical protein